MRECVAAGEAVEPEPPVHGIRDEGQHAGAQGVSGRGKEKKGVGKGADDIALMLGQGCVSQEIIKLLHHHLLV